LAVKNTALRMEMKNTRSLVVTGSAALSLLGFAMAPHSAHAAVDFVKDVKPILEMNCLSCHGAKNAHENGEFNLTTRALAIQGGDHETDLIPGDPDKSLLYRYTILDSDHKKLMPPKDKGGPLPKEQTEILRQWIAEGAKWPENITLANVMKVDFARDVKPILEKGGPISERDRETLKLWIDQGATWPKDMKLGGVGSAPIMDKELSIVTDLHNEIIAASKENSEAEMKKYTDTIPGQMHVTFDMVPIPSGEFVMGSPESEKGHKPDEAPQHKVKVDPFWMGKCEVTWDEYELFMYPEEGTKSDETYTSKNADAVTRPTKPYVEMSFGMGKTGFPAISMTQHGANKYCEWLSAKTGHFYRLPTEAEWEYACRAGTTTAYSFGNDASQLGDYAWFAGNSQGKYQKVGTKKPNPWGLYDMHGNVAEWTLDQYDPNYYKQFENIVAENPWNKASKPYPHAVRGGAWEEDTFGKAQDLRSAARIASDRSWKQQDPQLPKSIWYLTDAQFLGFRIVRPLKVPSPQEMKNYWNSGVEHE
jgi:formylglycine-generating enzyme required for sulfatase activity